MGLTAPAVSVVVASHDRPLRLRWLLNALEDQDAQVVVGHDGGEETEALLAGRGVRHARLPAGRGTPGANRNAAWRLAEADLIAFTDDDCRPAPDWVARLRAAAERHPGAVLQARPSPTPTSSGSWRCTAGARRTSTRRHGGRRATSPIRARCSSGSGASTRR